MLTRRSWVLRLSIFLNVAVLLYVATHIASRGDLLDELQAPAARSFLSVEAGESAGEAGDGSPPSAPMTPPRPASTKEASTTPEASPRPSSPAESRSEEPTPNPVTRALEDVVRCIDRSAEPRTAQRSDFWVLYNYVPAARTFRCWESITYTTHADYTFLDNLKPLLERWQGPVSLAVHAPGTDFQPTVDAIRYARDCLSPLVAELVTFHVFFGTRHVPRQIPRAPQLLAIRANCTLPAPWANVTSGALYKTKSKILYPVNIGRNVAREAATTHYILPSDIELYPSPNLIRDFLTMVRRQDPPLMHTNPKVFPLPIFELQDGSELPANKTQLVAMLKNGSAIPFHKKLCPGCHNVPRSKEWLAAEESEGLHVFHIGKRTGYFVHWEPIFIGTHSDPLYDERLSWEGKSDKMTQGYALCVLDYEFQILDNAFLVHKPGIKTLKKDPQRAMLAGKTNALIRKVIFPELKVLYGTRKGCAV
ncbi:beta-1,4-glucuronyltransferase 1 isoform X2 [Bacillus rossius redtenbacheri]